MSSACQLRKQLDQGLVVAPGVFNAVTAKMVEVVGFQAAYLSGAGLTNAMTAFPDIGLLTMSELAQQTAYIASAIRIPLIVDADTGFGGPLSVARTVRELERAGAAAIQIEDQQDPKRCGHLAGKRLIPANAMAEKIRSAAKARRNPDLVIIARTDARGVEGLKAAIDRARRYREAGADMIFPEAPESAAEFSRFADRVPGPLMANMTEFGKSPYVSVREFDRLGYRLVIFPMTIFRVMMKSAESALHELKRSGTQRRLLSRMQTRKELYALLNYEEYEKMEAEASSSRTRSPKRRD
ncbi:MAG TPA: methylisocitrate lyase [Nitrospiria bacterium]|nr:methylisocitrate lyase [Nitrospiria bacterium]